MYKNRGEKIILKCLIERFIKSNEKNVLESLLLTSLTIKLLASDYLTPWKSFSYWINYLGNIYVERQISYRLICDFKNFLNLFHKHKVIV